MFSKSLPCDARVRIVIISGTGDHRVVCVFVGAGGGAYQRLCVVAEATLPPLVIGQ